MCHICNLVAFLVAMQTGYITGYFSFSAYHRALVKCTYMGKGEGASPVLGDGGILICPRGTGVQAEEHTTVVKIAV